MIWEQRRINLRVLYCSENYCPHDHRFLSALSESEGDEIFWFRLERGDRLEEERTVPEDIHIVDWERGSGARNWFDYLRLQKAFSGIIERVKPDLIHAGPVQRVVLLPAMNDFHPLVTMSWGFDMLQDAGRNILWDRITQYVLRKSDWLIADCQTVKKKAAGYGFSPHAVTVFPWGVDLNLFSPRARSKARKAIGFNGKLLIIHTRSWEPRYGVDIALNGFKKALASNPAMHMLMLGGGSQSAYVHRFVEENGLSDHVDFVGYLSNEKLAQYYRAGDIYLSASHVDGSSVALLEAMGCGCVPVVSDIPSNLEWVRNDVTGWSFKDGSAEKLAEKLVKAGHTDLKNLRTAVREKIEKDGDWEKGKKKLLKTYQKAHLMDSHD